MAHTCSDSQSLGHCAAGMIDARAVATLAQNWLKVAAVAAGTVRFRPAVVCARAVGSSSLPLKL